MTEQRLRPDDAEIAAMVAGVRPVVLRHAASRRWWRRLSRPAVLASVAGAVAVGGMAYAAVERTTGSAPETHTGDSVLSIGKPGPKDNWLNVSVTYRCAPGESFELRDAKKEIFSRDCGTESSSEGDDGRRGMLKSIPVDEVNGTRLVMTSDFSHDYRLTATFGPRAAMAQANVLPPTGPDGKPAWDIPDYTVNEYGLTVGAPRVSTPESAYPDLYPVQFEGREAYILKKDMLGEVAGNPTEAVRQMKERRRLGLIDAKGNVYQFVYAADGKTRLGKVLIGTVHEG
ncbi:hypothetical protein [Aeromicrobium ginsengisoli]|uniref:Uncharacterized protein n=1 Tax=Aeromicrobium ginsengisoli TaxID=363867 RepID=A0A5M4FAJ9_9ACTN|nr:hypothetical protein [Aeromicrobium ginsengisoli]KAA1395416.1 hypothetical protein ESP70_014765 [Aeromicrobium ginsengisoli]